MPYFKIETIHHALSQAGSNLYVSRIYWKFLHESIKNKLIGLIPAHTKIKYKWHNIMFKCIKLLITHFQKDISNHYKTYYRNIETYIMQT